MERKKSTYIYKVLKVIEKDEKTGVAIVKGQSRLELKPKDYVVALEDYANLKNGYISSYETDSKAKKVDISNADVIAKLIFDTVKKDYGELDDSIDEFERCMNIKLKVIIAYATSQMRSSYSNVLFNHFVENVKQTAANLLRNLNVKQYSQNEIAEKTIKITKYVKSLYDRKEIIEEDIKKGIESKNGNSTGLTEEDKKNIVVEEAKKALEQLGTMGNIDDADGTTSLKRKK